MLNTPNLWSYQFCEVDVAEKSKEVVDASVCPPMNAVCWNFDSWGSYYDGMFNCFIEFDDNY